MSKRIVTCVEWVCDDCGKVCEYDDAPVHFRPGDLRPNEWEMIDGKDVCDLCIGKRACVAEGHQWDDWHELYTPPVRPREERRYCRRCDAAEARHG